MGCREFRSGGGRFGCRLADGATAGRWAVRTKTGMTKWAILRLGGMKRWIGMDVQLFERVQVGMRVNVGSRIAYGIEDGLETLGLELGMLFKETKRDLFEADGAGTSFSAFGCMAFYSVSRM